MANFLSISPNQALLLPYVFLVQAGLFCHSFFNLCSLFNRRQIGKMLTVREDCKGCLWSFCFCGEVSNSWTLNVIGRNFLLRSRKKIAKCLMRTFTYRSTFLYERKHSGFRSENLSLLFISFMETILVSWIRILRPIEIPDIQHGKKPQFWRITTYRNIQKQLLMMIRKLWTGLPRSLMLKTGSFLFSSILAKIPVAKSVHTKILGILHCKKKVSDFPIPTRYVTNQTLSGII